MNTKITEHGNDLIIKLSDYRNPRYIDEFLSMKCAGHLISMKMFPDAKEITETMGVWYAIKRITRDFKDEKRLLIDIGCSKRPRNAALIACLTKWQTISIDPQLEIKDYELDRLHLVPENFTIETNISELIKSRALIPGTYDNIIFVACHCHCPSEDIYKTLRNYSSIFPWKKLHLISVPCCYPDYKKLEDYKIESYSDKKIWSPLREVNIYKFPNSILKINSHTGLYVL